MKNTIPIFLAAAWLLLSACSRGQATIAACENAPSAASALDVCTQVIESKDLPAGDRARALSFRGGVKQSTGDGNGALADLDAAVAMAPKDANIRANRGAVYGMQKRMNRAIPDLLAAIELDPDNTLALGNLADIFVQRGDWASARALIDRALKAEPEHKRIWDERCWIGAVSDANPKDALADCAHAIQLANFPNTYNSRGLAYYRAGMFSESIADYDRSIAGDPSIASSYYMRGRAKRAAGIAGAQEDIDKGLAMEPGVAQRYTGYGVAAE